METTHSASDHFQLELLADGVFAAMATEGGAAFSNAGIIDLGDRTIVFDSFLTLRAARDLVAVARAVTGRWPSLVINSHWHLDHCSGNSTFNGATVIGTATTRDAITTTVAERLRQRRAIMPGEIVEFQQQLHSTADERERRRLENLIRVGHWLVETAEAGDARPPELLFKERLELRGSARSVEIIESCGHTHSDTYLYIPEEGILFTGDLVCVQGHHWLGDGEPGAWRRTLEHMERLRSDIILPGHGPVGTADDLRLMREYITALTTLAAEVVEHGGTAEDAAQRPIPDPFDAWRSTEVFARNMRFLHARMAPTPTV